MNLLFKLYVIISLSLFLNACANGPEKLDLKQDLTPDNSQYQWDLSDLYSDLAAWEDARLTVAEQVKELSKLQGTLGESAESLLNASDKISAVYKDVVRIYIYANLRADVDTRNAENEERSQLARNLFTDLSAATSWYSPELLAIGEEKLNQFLLQEPQLTKHRFNIHDSLRRAPIPLRKNLKPYWQKLGNLQAHPTQFTPCLPMQTCPGHR